MRKLFFTVVLLPFLSFSQNDLFVSVDGVETSTGKISIAVYNEEDGFLKFDRAFKSDTALAHKGRTKICIKDLPEGEYALAIFHDENSNDILDLNWLGIPKETVGFSNSKMKTFGPPSFKECRFLVTKNQEIKVVL